MNLTETPEIVSWPETHYLYIEKVGPFQDNAPAAWKELHALVPQISDLNRITGFLSLYKLSPQMIYRAGVALAEAPKKIPDSMRYVKFAGGKYARFVLTGSYSDLPEACGRVFEIITEDRIKLRNDFFIENYANDPKITPEADLVTEILIPMAL